MSITTEVIEVENLQSAKPVEDEFKQFVTEVERLKVTAETLSVTDEADVRGMKLAREARLTLREIRIGVEKRRKELGEDYLRKKQKIDAVAKELTKLIEPLEERLFEQETFAERKAAERQAQLQADRTEDLRSIGAPAHMMVQGLGTLTDPEWEIVRKDAVALKEAREAQARKEEEERIAREKAEREERERRERELAEATAKAEEERKAREAAEAQVLAERKAREKAEAEVRAAKEAAGKAAQAEAEARRRAEMAPDADQINEFRRLVRERKPTLGNPDLARRLDAIVDGFHAQLNGLTRLVQH